MTTDHPFNSSEFLPRRQFGCASFANFGIGAECVAAVADVEGVPAVANVPGEVAVAAVPEEVAVG